jgi:hypothetical protein
MMLKKTSYCGASLLVLFTKCNYNDEGEEDEMGRSLSTHGGAEEYIQAFSGKATRKDTFHKTQT